ncbi:MAG: DUF2062 domain-containing protein [Desulfomonilaceae bacterium]
MGSQRENTDRLEVEDMRVMIRDAADPREKPYNPENKPVGLRSRIAAALREAEARSSDLAGRRPDAATGLWARGRELVRKNVIDPLIFSQHSPSFDAAGVALGFVVGFGCPFGSHVLTLSLLRLLFRFNLVLAVAFTFVINPINIVPFYYGYYRLGSLVLGRPVAINLEIFQRIMNPVLNKAYFWEAHAAFIQLGSEILARWLVSAVILATVSGVLGYIVTFRVQKERCMRRARMLGIQYEKYLAEVEKKARADEK